MKSALALTLALATSPLTSSCGKTAETSKLASDQTYVNVLMTAPNIRMGRGYNTLQEKAQGDCLVQDFTLEALPETIDSRTTDYTLEVLRSRSQFMKEAGVSAKASLSFAVFGGSAAFETMNTRRFEEDSLIVVFRAKVLNSDKTLGPVQLTEEYKEIYRNSPADFQKRCGDSYISGIRTGAQIHAIFEYQGLTSSEMERITAAAKASMPFFKASGTLQSSQIESLTHSRLTVRQSQNGGPFKVVSSVDEFFASAAGFSENLRSRDTEDGLANSAPFYVTLQNYYAAGLPGIIDETPLSIQDHAITIRKLSGRYDSLRNLLNSIEYAAQHPEQFKPFNRNKLAQSAALVEEAITDTLDMSKMCYAKLPTCKDPGPFTLPRVTLPKAKEDAPVAAVEAPKPQIIGFVLRANTTNENKDKHRGYSVSIQTASGVEVGRSNGIVSVGLEYPEGSQHEVAIPLATAGIDIGQDFRLIVNNDPENAWNVSLRVYARVQIGDEVKEYVSNVVHKQFDPNQAQINAPIQFN